MRCFSFRLWLFPLFLVSLLILPGMMPAELVSSGSKGGKFKTITRTFTNPTAITMSDAVAPAHPYPSSIVVSGFKKGKVRDVNLTLRNLSHTDPDDIDVLLVKEGGGRNALVFSDVAGSNDAAGVTLTLDDEASASLPDDAPLVSGTFKPTNFGPPGDFFEPPAPAPDEAAKLSTFDGLNPNGTWQLFVVDEATPDSGAIADGWQLQIRARTKIKK